MSDEEEPTSSSTGPKLLLINGGYGALNDLRAEVLQKSATKPKKRDPYAVNKTKKNIFAKPNSKKQEERERRERIREHEHELRRQEDAAAEFRRKNMEAKSKMYDRMKAGERPAYEDGTELEFLVDFQRRDRSLSPFMERDRSRSRSPIARSPTPPPAPLAVHYDPDDDKGRMLGASFVPLPKDEEERLKRIQELEQRTIETHQVRVKRKKQQSEQRKLERMQANMMREARGLPLLESSEEEEEEVHPGEGLDPNSIPLPPDPDAERKAEEERKKKFEREWDRGKVREIQWVKSRRDERDPEFQPPAFY